MKRNKRKVLREYYFPEVKHVELRGKITRLGKYYLWDLSHFCSFSENAIGTYYPSRGCNTIDEGERAMKGYALSFTEYKVKVNEFFDRY